MINWLAQRGAHRRRRERTGPRLLRALPRGGPRSVARHGVHRHPGSGLRGPWLSLDRYPDQRKRQFDYGSTSEGEAADKWRRSAFYHMLENDKPELHVDLADRGSHDFSMIDDLAASGHRHFLGFVHRFGEAGIDRPDGLRLFLLGDAPSRRLRRQPRCGAARSGAGAGAGGEDGDGGAHRPHRRPGLSRPRCRRAGDARPDLPRRHRLDQRGAVVFRPARIDRDQRIHRAPGDHSVPQRLRRGLHQRHPRLPAATC